MKIISSKVHGDKLGEKEDGHIRFAFENFNGLAPWYTRNDKLILARKFLHRIQVDCYLGTEYRAQWDLLRHASKLEQIFKSEVQIKTIAAHNIHDNDSRLQEGGTEIIAFDQLVTLQDLAGLDPTGLGKWSWIKIIGKQKRTTRITCAYQPCSSKKTSLSSVGSQQRRHFKVRENEKCPRASFRGDLIIQLKVWIKVKNRILLFIDVNEDLSNGPLSRSFKEIKLRDLVNDRTHISGPNTHFTGKAQIDNTFASMDIDCAGARFLLFWVGIGDRRPLVIDISQHVLYGENLLRIVRPQG